MLSLMQTFIGHLGEEKYQELVNFCLHYIADLKIPIKRYSTLPTVLIIRGTFVEFRNGMINVSPVGRNASSDERNAYEKYDKEHKIREKFIAELQKKFPDIGLTYSIGWPCSRWTNGRWTNFIRLFPDWVG